MNAQSRAIAFGTAATRESSPTSGLDPDGRVSAIADVNLTRIMLRNDVQAIKRWPGGRFSVELQDGRFGIGASVGEALDIAKAGAVNLRRVG